MNKSVATQVLDFHKSVFDTSFALMADLQDQGQEMMAEACEKNPFFPKGNDDLYTHWIAYVRENRENCKAYMDGNLERIRDFFNANPYMSR